MCRNIFRAGVTGGDPTFTGGTDQSISERRIEFSEMKIKRSKIKQEEMKNSRILSLDLNHMSKSYLLALLIKTVSEPLSVAVD